LSDDVPAGGLGPETSRAAYDITPLYEQGIRGQGETIALISFARFNQSDLDSFSDQFGLPRFTPKDIPSTHDGGAVDSSADGVGEADLDAEVVHEIAPRAEILNYNAPQLTAEGNDAFGELVDQIVADGRADIVSDSYGYCELTFPGSDLLRDEHAIDAAVAHGISIFKSTGDNGAYQCQKFSQSDRRISVEWPASSGGVVAVGGTTLSVTPTGNYAGESAWEGTLTESGGGGGLSAYVPRPGWQRGPGVANRFSNGRRQIPDISGAANPFYGWATFNNGDTHQLGGTSASSPFLAGSIALVEQYARQHGVRRLGFVDPMLYAIASTPQKFPPFHDVTLGDNRYYPATPGWDFATGLGSPDVFNLAQDVVAYLKSHP
jgi:kumamolisin